MAYNKKQLVPLKIKYEGSAPATPESGFGVIYFDTSSQLLAFKNAAGTSGLISTPSFPMNAGTGSAGAPSIYFGDSDSGIYATGLNSVQISTIGTEKIAVVNNDVTISALNGGGRLYLGTGGPYIRSNITTGTDVAQLASSHYFRNVANNVEILELDVDNVSCYRPVILRPDNSIDLGITTGGSLFRPRHARIGTTLGVGTASANGTSEIARFESTSKAVTLPNLTSAPSTPLAGMVAFDTNASVAGTNKLALYNGTAWKAVTTGGLTQQNTDTTQHVSNNGSETDMASYSVPASTLATNGDQLQFEYAGQVTSGFGTVQIKAKFGGTTLVDSGSMSVSGGFDWIIKGSIIRTGATTQKAICQFITNTGTLVLVTKYSAPAETLSGAVTLKTTADVDDMMMGGMACNNEMASITFVPGA